MFSGMMLAQYTAGALCCESRILSHPAATGSIPAAADQEDFVSMGMTTALKTKQILKNAHAVLGIEMIAAAQAMDFRRPLRGGKGTEAAYEVIRKHVAVPRGGPPALRRHQPDGCARRVGRDPRRGGKGSREAGVIHRSGYVALVGLPNAGKSTLLNHLVRSRLGIVSPKPQTTRRRTLGIVTGEGYQIVLLDTPGIIDPKYPLQKALMKTVGGVLGDADLAAVLLDAGTARPGRLDIPDRVMNFSKKRIAVLNKIDLLPHKQQMIPLLESIAGTGLFTEIVPISALTGEGVDRLLSVLVSFLPEGPPFYPEDQLTEQPERFFVGELIREAAFHRFQEEIPYSIEVEITEFKERPDSKDYIEAVLFVEQDSQKAIVIGRHGQAIRALGEAARVSIEQFLERPVYLDLRVKVAPKWRRNEAALRRLGYRT